MATDAAAGQPSHAAAAALTGLYVAQLAARSKAGPPVRLHSSPMPLAEVREVEQDGRASAMGLWFDVHCEWLINATARGDFRQISGRYVHAVDLGESRLLHIATARDFDEFEDRYATCKVDTILYPSRAHQLTGRGVRVRGRHVDWRAVARDYDGIEISPYRADRPAKTGRHAWFASWDISSGCVWRPKGVRLTVLGRVPGEVTTWAAANP